LIFIISCSEGDGIKVVKSAAPKASFTTNIKDLKVVFENTTTNGVFYQWDFGDGSTSTETNPVHTYATDGDYLVKLSVVGGPGNLPVMDSSIVSVKFSWTDVTATYLKNPGFDTDCTYKVGGTEVVGTTSPPTTNPVSDWTVGTSESWGVAASVEYGWNGTFNTSSAPASGSDGSSGSGHGAMAMSIGWSGTITYTQEVTLPAGLYSIEVVSLFTGTDGDIDSNLTGWSGSDGTTAFTQDIHRDMIDVWDTTYVSFTLDAETTGNIQVGHKARNAGTGSNPKIFTDYIKLRVHPE